MRKTDNRDQTDCWVRWQATSDRWLHAAVDTKPDWQTHCDHKSFFLVYGYVRMSTHNGFTWMN